jgi:D-glycero-D-manno-heptose 1,7-bisphosphate phosphatase
MGIHSGRRAAVFLDRDGVVSRAVVREGRPFPPDTVEALEVMPGARDALGRLRDAGYRLVVITNQPDIARGTQDRATVDRMHERLAESLPIDEFRVCPHDDADGCRCRKPKPGMIEDAARSAGLDPSASVVVGDRWRDIEAGRAAGCRTVFIDYHYRERRPSAPDAVVGSLAEAADWILRVTRNAG